MSRYDSPNGVRSKTFSDLVSGIFLGKWAPLEASAMHEHYRAAGIFLLAVLGSVGCHSRDDGGAGIQYTFALPVPPGTDCDGGTAPACSPNCAATSWAMGCLPCVPSPPTVAYEANGASDCVGVTRPASGSWRIELTSTTPVAGDDNEDYYLAHGSLSANLLGASDSSAKLSLAF
jgi:hypothetical protein